MAEMANTRKKKNERKKKQTRRERNISAVARKKIGAVIHINHSYFIYMYFVFARSKWIVCVRVKWWKDHFSPMAIDYDERVKSKTRVYQRGKSKSEEKESERTCAQFTRTRANCRGEWIIIVNKQNANGAAQSEKNTGESMTVWDSFFRKWRWYR